MDVDGPANGTRTVDIELGAQDVVTVDLENLDPNPDDIIEVLVEAQSPVWLWVRFAVEYWRKGLHPAVQRICDAAITAFSENDSANALWPVYAFKANICLFDARKAPKFVLATAAKDKVADPNTTKETCYKDAARMLNEMEKGREEAGEADAFQTLINLTRSAHLLTNRKLDEALQGFDAVLAIRPTNIAALLGKARVFFARKDFQHSLIHFQRVLSLSPSCRPDPRIGIGLCLWSLGDKDKARSAWERSVEVNPDHWAAHVVLGIDEINKSKDAKRSEEDRAVSYASGSKHIERAFRTNNKVAAAANALSEFFLRKGDHNNALKLAERTVQYADTLNLLSDGHLRIARVLHAQGSTTSAMEHYQEAVKGQQKNVPALGLAQMQLADNQAAAAIHTLDSLLQGSSSKSNTNLEASIMLASLRANPRPGVSSAEIQQDRLRARGIYEQVLKALEVSESQGGDERSQQALKSLGDDLDMYIEVGRLWQGESPGKMENALNEALRIAQSSGEVDPRLINNIAALKHVNKDIDGARVLYEEALGILSSETASKKEEVSSTVLYNLARAYEEQEEWAMANDAYSKLLERHPEYVDARIRQAQMLKDINQINEAHELLKHALTSQNHNLNLRAFYTYFLLQSNLIRPAKDFVFATLKDHDKHDLYALCSAGLIMYQQAREARDPTADGLKARRRNFERSIEFYEKALSLDPTCAVAAQGLAIVTVEDSLGALSGGQPVDDAHRAKLAREGLDVFAKIRETLTDGSVYANMGHCYYTRDEFERAIECYETASKKFYRQQDVPVLQSLSRANYAKAIKDQSYQHMSVALTYAQKALHLSPHDKAVVYNIAMIQQKAAEMLFDLDPAKRTLQDLRRAIEHAKHAQSQFASLASDKSSILPYNRDLADQRRKYGEIMLRKADEHIAAQESHEAEIKEKLDAARLRRLEEKERINTLEQQRIDELRMQAEELAAHRRKAREEAMAWTAAARAESDEDRERKQAKKPKKSKAEVESGDEPTQVNGEPKKKRKGKLKKGDAQMNGAGEMHGEEMEALFSADEEEKPKKRIPKKRVIRDEDEDEGTAGPRKKQIKSKETISDSDEGMD